MLGLSSNGGSAIGSQERLTASLQPYFRARVNQFAVVAPTAEHIPAYASQFALVVPSADLAIPSAGAQMQQLAFVAVVHEYELKADTHGYTMRQLWGFPLLIQTEG